MNRREMMASSAGALCGMTVTPEDEAVAKTIRDRRRASDFDAQEQAIERTLLAIHEVQEGLDQIIHAHAIEPPVGSCVCDACVNSDTISRVLDMMVAPVLESQLYRTDRLQQREKQLEAAQKRREREYQTACEDAFLAEEAAKRRS